MIHHLWFKLTSAFALIILIGVVVTTLLARQGTDARFAHLMVGQYMVRPEVLQQTLKDYYAAQGGWNELNLQFNRIAATSSDGMMSGMMGGMMGSIMGMAENHIQVVDQQGAVIADSSVSGTPSLATTQPLNGAAIQRWAILVDGQEVGAILAEGSLMSASLMHDAQIVQGVTRAVLLAGLIAGVVGMVLAWLLVRQITRPLATLTSASERIANGDLAARVSIASSDEFGTLATTFNRMATNLQTQETLRRNLVADVAHELRTPLTGIQGTVEAIEDGIFPLTTEQIGSIHEQVMLLNRLVEDLRTLTNAEAGQIRLDKTAFDLAELCESEVQAFQAQAKIHQIHLQLCIKDKPPLINADSQRIGQVLNNLLSNALRHTPANGKVEVTLSRTQQGAQVAVTDSGEGINAEDLAHVFDRFYRTDASRQRQTGGSGLGLAIARQLVEAHGGKLWAESPPSEQSNGSRFIFMLPSAT